MAKIESVAVRGACQEPETEGVVKGNFGLAALRRIELKIHREEEKALRSRDTRNLEVPPGGREAGTLMLDYVSDRSVAMLLRPTPGSLGIGSATCIRIGGHYLLATAAHNIADIREDEGIRLLPYGRNDQVEMSFLHRSHPRQSAFTEDVAWLEIREEEVLAGGLTYFGVEDLQPYQAHDPLRPFFLQGYPAAEVELDGERVSPLSLGLKTISLAPRRNEEFAVEYPPQSKEDIGLELTHPGGISGGGIWLESRFQDSLIWSPSQSRLVAIATTWEEISARLLAARVEHWLELVLQDFPDLNLVIAPLLVGSIGEEAANPAARTDG
jgi:hypothetical protein